MELNAAQTQTAQAMAAVRVGNVALVVLILTVMATGVALRANAARAAQIQIAALGVARAGSAARVALIQIVKVMADARVGNAAHAGLTQIAKLVSVRAGNAAAVVQILTAKVAGVRAADVAMLAKETLPTSDQALQCIIATSANAICGQGGFSAPASPRSCKFAWAP